MSQVVVETGGAGGIGTITRIVIPFLRGGLFSVWIRLFQIYLREVAGAVIRVLMLPSAALLFLAW